VHGLHTANTAVARCDLLLALGCRFDERAACKAFELWDSPRPVVHVDLAPQKAMSGSPKNMISCAVEADCEDFVGVLLQHLYGFIEERRHKFTSEGSTAYQGLHLQARPLTSSPAPGKGLTRGLPRLTV
jgi:thiamine pyrophosphate-dependent acetolactate synthase large subunit-like protein